MEWILAALAVVAIALAAVASTGRGGGLPDLVDDRPAPELPAGELTAADLQGVSLAVVPRGYSMTQVDQLLDRLSRQLSAGQPADATFVVDDVVVQPVPPAREPATADVRDDDESLTPSAASAATPPERL